MSSPIERQGRGHYLQVSIDEMTAFEPSDNYFLATYSVYHVQRRQVYRRQQEHPEFVRPVKRI